MLENPTIWIRIDEFEYDPLKLKQLQINDPALPRLALHYRRTGNSDAKKLSEALKENTNLTDLSLIRCMIGDEGVEYLCAMLKVNRTLTTLCLSQNLIGNVGVKYLIAALQKNPTLTFLNLADNSIGAAGAQDLGEELRWNKTLTTLDLSGNYIGAAGVKYIIEALKWNKTLTFLSLVGNRLGDTSAKDFSEVLNENKTLTSLDLGGNNIGDPGVKDLCEALKGNRTLTYLGLWRRKGTIHGLTDVSQMSNKLTAVGVKYLSEMLKVNKTLTNIDLKDNLIDEEGKAYLIEGLATNFTLLNLDGVNDSSVIKYLKRNNTLAQILNSLKTSFAKDPDSLLDEGIIGEYLKQLNEWRRCSLDRTPEILDELKIPQASFRLLAGLKNLAKYESDEQPLDSLFDALLYLTPTFAETSLHALADWSRYQLIQAFYVSSSNQENLEIKNILLEVMLYSLRNHLDKPDVRLLAYDAISQLEKNLGKNVAQNISPFDILQLQNKLAILSYNEALSIAWEALNFCQNSKEANSVEITFLTELLNQKEYHPLVIEYLFKSPAFFSGFKQKYAQNEYAIVEQCLFAETPDYADRIRINVPGEPKNLPVTMLHVYRNQAKNFTPPFLFDVLQQKRELIEKNAHEAPIIRL